MIILSKINKTEPLAYRMRPKSIDEIVGQEQLIGPNKIIRRMVDANNIQSMILFGPPGTGKTSMASAISGSSDIPLRMMNAATGKKSDLEMIAEEARFLGRIILLLDEIHRLDKPKQDFLLPQLESGRVILIGATTENPYIAINPAIRSRSNIFELNRLSPDDIKIALTRALIDKKDGLGKLNVIIGDEELIALSESAGGDVRSALNSLELAVNSTPADEDNNIIIGMETIKEVSVGKAFTHDKDGDSHYDTLSAFQKSIRGSDVDASLHYLARLINAGDLISICRRLSIIAFEDVGLANEGAVNYAISAIEVAKNVGFPEAQIPLSSATIKLALSRKSNTAYIAIKRAREDVSNGILGEIPSHIRDNHYSGASDMNRGVDYLYPHDYKDNWVNQQYLPDNLIGIDYYPLEENSSEEELRLMRLNEVLKNARQHDNDDN